jgi:hypothetical protein
MTAGQDTVVVVDDAAYSALPGAAGTHRGGLELTIAVAAGLDGLLAGDTPRAEAFVELIIDPSSQAQALSGIARVVAARDLVYARTLVERAENIARTISAPYRLEAASAELLRSLAVIGETSRAESLVASLTHGSDAAQALGRIAGPLLGQRQGRAC